jgi:hypothetical protein
VSKADTTEQDIRRWCRQLRDECTRAKLIALEDELVDAYRRNKRGGRVVVDGYPSATMGGGSGGAELTSVESAADRRSFGAAPKDPLAEKVATAVDMLGQAAASMGATANVVAQIRTLAGKAPDVKHCQGCKPAGIRHEPDRYARDLRGLTEPMEVCQPFYDYVHKHGEQPTLEQIRHYDAHGTWRVRVDPKQRKASA